MTRFYRFTVLSFLMAVSLMVSSTSATCANGPAFIDGTCMTDIYAFVTVKIPFNNSTNFLVDLTDVTSSVAGGSWGLGGSTPTFMIAPGTNVADPTVNSYYNVYQTADGLSLGSQITANTTVSNGHGLIFVSLNTTAAPANTSFNAYWDISVLYGSGLSQTGKILFEFYDPVCADTITEVDTYSGSPPLPTATIQWNNVDHTMHFVVTSEYLRDTQTMLVDFADFDLLNDDVRDATTCGNRPDLSGMPFAYLWNSAETLDQPDAIGGVFGAYPSTAGTKWTVQADACNEISYAANISISDLMSCKTRSNVYAIDIDNTGATNQDIAYSGSLYWNVIRPIDPADETYGYASFRTEFPFQLSFKSRFTAIVASVSEIEFYVFIRSAQVGTDGALTFVVEVEYPGRGLTSPSVSGPSALVVVGANPANCSANADDDICTQLFTYSGPGWSVNDNGLYNFTWLSDDGHPITAMINIVQEMENVVVETGLTYGTCSLSVYDSNESNMRSGSNAVDSGSHRFNPEDEVLIRADINLESVDRTNFNLTVVNAWVCYTTISQYDIQYDGTTHFGCLDPIVAANGEVIQLVNSYALSNTLASSGFNARLVEDGAWSNPVGPSAGIGFSAFPITQNRNTYTIQLEVEMTQASRSKKRMMQLYNRAFNDPSLAGTKNAIAQVQGNYVPEQPKSYAGIIAGIGAAVAFVVLAAAVAAVVVLKIRKQQPCKLPAIDIPLEEFDV